MASADDAQPGRSRPRGRPRKESFAARGERLLDEAVEIFAAQGPGASVNVLAERAGINKALVYQHFPSKHELFAAAVRRERDRLTVYVAEAQAAAVVVGGGEATGRRRVRAQFHAFLDFASAHPTAVALLARPEAAALLDGTGRDAVTDSVARNVRRALQDRDLPAESGPDVLASMLVGMAGAVIRAGADAGGSWDAEAVVDLLTDFTLGGLAAIDAEVLERIDRPPDR